MELQDSRMKITSQKVTGMDAVEIISQFLLMPHVLSRLNQNIRSLPKMYKLLKAVEIGNIGCFIAQDEVGTIIGISWGYMVNATDWENHFAFARKTDALAGCRAMIEQLKLCYGARRIIGNIPECHKAAKLLTRRLGFADFGLTENIHITDDDREYPCRKFILEI